MEKKMKKLILITDLLKLNYTINICDEDKNKIGLIELKPFWSRISEKINICGQNYFVRRKNIFSIFSSDLKDFEGNKIASSKTVFFVTGPRIAKLSFGGKKYYVEDQAIKKSLKTGGIQFMPKQVFLLKEDNGEEVAKVTYSYLLSNSEIMVLIDGDKTNFLAFVLYAITLINHIEKRTFAT